MIVTDKLTIGQLTFILRVAIQILTYGGLFLIGLIILGSAPRVATLNTHDVVNRVVGKSTVNISTAKWIFARLWSRNRDPTAPAGFIFALFLLVTYGIVTSLSDIGFLGFHACTTSGPSFFDFPASVATDDMARSLLSANLVNGTDPGAVKAYRCDAAEVVQLNVNQSVKACTAWRNSTYADPTMFIDLNMTDTDVLMPRQLSRSNRYSTTTFDVNSFYVGLDTQRLSKAVIKNGLAIIPGGMGLVAVVGVPQLGEQQKVTLPKTMALEVEVGCMEVGIYTSLDLDVGATGWDLFATDSRDWRRYAGPDHLRDVLSKTVDEIRQHYTPLFNGSSLDEEGFIYAFNRSQTPLSAYASIHRMLLPDAGSVDGVDASFAIFGNCTNAMKRQFGLPTLAYSPGAGTMCGMLGIGGSSSLNGTAFTGKSRMVCASVPQLNMVSATLEVDERGDLSVDLVHLPSDIRYIDADFWNIEIKADQIQYAQHGDLDRYTLSDNGSSPTRHYIVPRLSSLNGRSLGPGSGGTAFAMVGDAMLQLVTSTTTDAAYVRQMLLEDGYDQQEFSPQQVAKWLGQVGGSFILTSTAYNGWAARAAAPINVVSTGGKVATCYKPQYGIGFLPLTLAAFIVVSWALWLLVTSALSAAQRREELYGGMSPYASTVCPNASKTTTHLVWDNQPHPHLELLSEGEPVHGDASELALKHLKYKI